jgi:hypothetical protein
MSPSPLAAAIFGFVVLSASLATAERVVLVRPPSVDATLVDAWHRLEAELRIHRFDTDVVDPTANEAPAEMLSRVAERERAFAAIGLVRHAGSASVDVWLVDRASGKTTMRTIEVENGSDASSVLAIRAVDLLRASLREFSAGTAPPDDVAGVDRWTAGEAVRSFAAPAAPSTSVRAEALLLVEGGLGVAVGPALAVSYRLLDSLEVGVGAAGPLLGAHLDTQLGSASTHQEEAWGELRFRVLRASIVSAGVHAMAGVHFLAAQGEPHAPLRGQTESLAAFLAGAGADLDVAFSRTVAVVVAASAAGTAPRLGVAVARESSPIDAPIVGVSAGIRVGL